MPDCVNPLPTQWYSGYIELTTQKSLHYVLVESADNPLTDPLIVYFNGGPGCTSMHSLFVDLGPFVIDDGENVIKPNAWSWN